MRFLIAAVCLLTLFTGCKPALKPQQLVDHNAANLTYRIELISNYQPERSKCVELGAEWATCNRFDLILGANDNGVISGEWFLYIHSVRRILEFKTDLFEIEHLTGDLYRVTPTDRFEGFSANESHRIEIVGEFFELSKYDFIPGAFVAAAGAEPKLLAATAIDDIDAFVADIPDNELLRHEDDQTVIETSATRFDSLEALNSDAPLISSGIFPTPKRVELGNERVLIRNGLALELMALSPASFDVIKQRASEASVSLNGDFPLIGAVLPNSFSGANAISGAYRLSITEDGIGVSAFDDRGLYYGMSTLLDLIDDGSLPLGEVVDAPRFEYRGVMLDVARNFHSKEFVLQLIDEMSRTKLNKLALHLTDDEGWRLEIPSLPELTDVGSKRCLDLDETECLLPQLGSGPNTNNFGSGHFSRDDFIEILSYAAARQVDVIPEIDMPAHARAAVVSMEARYKHYAALGDLDRANEFRLLDPNDTTNVTTVQFYDRLSFINPCLASSYRFTETVVRDVAKMYRDAGLSLDTWHFGGDEAKNIQLGGGFQDHNNAELTDFQGAIDRSGEHMPFENSPACRALIESGTIDSVSELPSFWAIEVSKIAANQGFANFQAWEDGLKHASGVSDFATERTRVNFWEILSAGGAKNAHTWAAKDYDLIISVPDYLYLDFPQAIDQNERGYYWATRANTLKRVFSFAPENLPQNASNSVNRDGKGFTIESAENPETFHGMSVQLWSELVRNDEQAEYMMYPRLYAAAERAWHRAAWELDFESKRTFSFGDGQVNQASVNADYSRFTDTLGEIILPRLHAKGIAYRMPLPAARITNGTLNATVELPGFDLQYSIDGGTSWLTYHRDTSPNVMDATVLMRTHRDGRFSRIVEVR